jgi:hypothetical protein
MVRMAMAQVTGVTVTRKLNLSDPHDPVWVITNTVGIIMIPFPIPGDTICRMGEFLCNRVDCRGLSMESSVVNRGLCRTDRFTAL